MKENLGYYIFGGAISFVLCCAQSFFGILLITPRDVGGTLFGGMFRDLFCFGSWFLLTVGLIMLIIVRLVGSRLALLCASSLQIVACALSIFNYPCDDGGDIIFSPTMNEIYFMMAMIGFLLLCSVYIIKQGHFHPDLDR